MKLSKLIQKLQTLETKYGSDTDVDISYLRTSPPWIRVHHNLIAKKICILKPKTNPKITISL